MQGSKSVSTGLPTGQNALPVPILSPTQQSKPIGDMNRITNMALSRPVVPVKEKT
jgi:hypothetical protein